MKNAEHEISTISPQRQAFARDRITILERYRRIAAPQASDDCEKNSTPKPFLTPPIYFIFWNKLKNEEGRSMTIPAAYGLLPKPYQHAVHQYMMVDGYRPDFAEELLFVVGEMSATDIKTKCWNAPDNDMRENYPDWDSYHADYCSGLNPDDYIDHLSRMWPVILCEREGITDGWHRLHWYLRNGVSMIPTIDFVEKTRTVTT